MSPSDASLPKNSATHNQRIGQGSCISRSFLGLKLCTSGVSFTGVSWEFPSVSLSIFCCFYTQSMTHTLLSSSQDMGPWDSAAPTMFLSRQPPSSLTQAQQSWKKACQRRAIACCGNILSWTHKQKSTKIGMDQVQGTCSLPSLQSSASEHKARPKPCQILEEFWEDTQKLFAVSVISSGILSCTRRHKARFLPKPSSELLWPQQVSFVSTHIDVDRKYSKEKAQLCHI